MAIVRKNQAVSYLIECEFDPKSPNSIASALRSIADSIEKNIGAPASFESIDYVAENPAFSFSIRFGEKRVSVAKDRP